MVEEVGMWGQPSPWSLSMKKCSYYELIKLYGALKYKILDGSSSSTGRRPPSSRSDVLCKHRTHQRMKSSDSMEHFIDELCQYQNFLGSSSEGKSKRITQSIVSYEKLALASTGFMLFVKLCTDEIFEKLFKMAVRSGRCPVNYGVQFIAMILRYSWCHLRRSTRQRWEEISIDSIATNQPEIEVDSQTMCGPVLNAAFDKIDSISAKKWRLGGISCAGYLKCPLCKDDNDVPETSLQDHLLNNHENVVLYACHYCFEAFDSMQRLKTHPCEGFAEHILSLYSSNSQLTLHFVLHTVVCIECGLQLPLPSVILFKSCTIRRLKSLRQHDSSKLVSCLVLLVECKKQIKFITFKKHRKHVSFSMSCSICKHTYNSIPGIESHLIQHENAMKHHECPQCHKEFLSEILYKSHVLKHISDLPTLEGLSNVLSSKGELDKKFCSEILCDDVKLALRMTGKPSVTNTKKEEKYEVCRYCRQIYTMNPRHLASDICECGIPGKISNVTVELPFRVLSPSVDLLLFDALFNDEIKICVGGTFFRAYDIMQGELPLLSLFMCTKCNSLALGLGCLMKHLDKCYNASIEFDKCSAYDLESEGKITCLWNFESLPNTRIGCPSCTRSSCSIRSLRVHLWTAHDIFADILLPDSLKFIDFIGWNGYPPYNDITLHMNDQLGLSVYGKFRDPSGHPICNQNTLLTDLVGSRLSGDERALEGDDISRSWDISAQHEKGVKRCETGSMIKTIEINDHIESQKVVPCKRINWIDSNLQSRAGESQQKRAKIMETDLNAQYSCIDGSTVNRSLLSFSANSALHEAGSNLSSSSTKRVVNRIFEPNAVPAYMSTCGRLYHEVKGARSSKGSFVRPVRGVRRGNARSRFPLATRAGLVIQFNPSSGETVSTLTNADTTTDFDTTAHSQLRVMNQLTPNLSVHRKDGDDDDDEVQVIKVVHRRMEKPVVPLSVTVPVVPGLYTSQFSRNPIILRKRTLPLCHKDHIVKKKP